MLVRQPDKRIDVKDILLDSDIHKKLENPPEGKCMLLDIHLLHFNLSLVCVMYVGRWYDGLSGQGSAV